MAEYTKNYNLKKPFQEEFYNIDDFNINIDTLDSKIPEEVEGVKDWVKENFAKENLLKNGDFKFWSKGTSFKDINWYGVTTADNWYMTVDTNAGSTMTLEKSSDGYAHITGDNKILGGMMLYQTFTKQEFPYLSNKVVTITYDIETNMEIINSPSHFPPNYIGVAGKTVIFPEGRNKVLVTMQLSDFLEGQNSIQFIRIDTLKEDIDIKIYSIKMELGEFATQMSPKSYPLEILENSTKNSLPFSNPNLLSNGDFQVWSQGTYFTNARIYCADMWATTENLYQGRIVSKGFSPELNSNTFLLNSMESESVDNRLITNVRNANTIKGKYTTLSFWAKTSNTNKTFSAQIRLYSRTQIVVSKDVPCTIIDSKGDFNKYVSTFLIDSDSDFENDNSYFTLLIAGNSSYTLKVINEYAQIKLEIGKVATPFVPRTYLEELLSVDRVEYQANKSYPFSNPNLLINSDFRNPINQRGYNKYSKNGYTIDRWKLIYSPTNIATVSVNNGYVSLSKLEASSSAVYFSQYIEDYKMLLGETVTITVELLDGSVYTKALDIPNITTGWIDTTELILGKTNWLADIYGSISNNSLTLRFYCLGVNTGTVDITRVKLELGHVATPLVTQSYGEELIVCNRYYEKVSTMYVPYKVSYDQTSGNYAIRIEFISPKRILPVVTTYTGSFITDAIGKWASVGQLYPIISKSVDKYGCTILVSKTSSNGGTDLKDGDTLALIGWEADAEL